MNQESLGKLFKNGDVVYKCVAYADTPTITMQNIETGEKINMCTNSLLATCFEEVIEDNKKIETLDIELSPDDGDKVNGYLVCEVTRDLAFKINEIIEVINNGTMD